MRKAALFCCVVLMMAAGCARVEDEPMTSIIGATLIDGTGKPPVPESVVIVLGNRVQEAGDRVTVPTPARARNVDGRGKFLAPQLIDLGKSELAEAATNAELKELLESGAKAYGCLPEEIDPELLARLRESGGVFAPGLSRLAGDDLARAMRQTKQMISEGVPLAVASAGDAGRELELLSEAGLAPMDVIVAATRNGAMAKQECDKSGTITEGKLANLVLLAGNPLEDIRSLARPERTMINGRWID